jgi:hypothetical protein
VSPARLAAVLALTAAGAGASWSVAASNAPSNGELRQAAIELVPSRTWLDGVTLVDRPPSFSNPPWDTGGSRYAEALLKPPSKVDEQALEQAVARQARATGWRPSGVAGSGAPRYRRSNLEATVETTSLEPATAIEAAIRIRPRSLRPDAAAALGGTSGLLAGLLLVLLLRRRRPDRAPAARLP